jgi:ABC-type phosphate transport system substrate-binding protein
LHTQLPEILNKGILVLNMNVVAGILRNTITHWRDEAILALNPTIEDLLPNREILPVFSSGFSVVTQVWTQVLAEAVRNWNSTVGVTGYPDPFPVVGSNSSYVNSIPLCWSFERLYDADTATAAVR